MRKNVTGSLVEDVRELSSLGAYAKRGRMNIKEALKIVASKYEISSNPDDYAYLVLVACHADEPNNNGDAFRMNELERFDPKYGCKVYQTFILKPHFIEHKQDGKVYGFILDAHLEQPKEGKPYVEVVLAVDTKKDPIYGRLVREGKVQGKFSMGCTVDWTECNVCGNKAYTEKEFCDHIKQGKMRMHRAAAGVLKLAFEWCYGVCYDEISRVQDPADPAAIEEERLASKRASVISVKRFSGIFTVKAREVASAIKNDLGQAIDLGDVVVSPLIKNQYNITDLGGGLIGEVAEIAGRKIRVDFDPEQTQLIYENVPVGKDETTGKPKYQRVERWVDLTPKDLKFYNEQLWDVLGFRKLEEGKEGFDDLESLKANPERLTTRVPYVQRFEEEGDPTDLLGKQMSDEELNDFFDTLFLTEVQDTPWYSEYLRRIDVNTQMGDTETVRDLQNELQDRAAEYARLSTEWNQAKTNPQAKKDFVERFKNSVWFKIAPATFITHAPDVSKAAPEDMGPAFEEIYLPPTHASKKLSYNVDEAINWIRATIRRTPKEVIIGDIEEQLGVPRMEGNLLYSQVLHEHYGRCFLRAEGPSAIPAIPPSSTAMPTEMKNAPVNLAWRNNFGIAIKDKKINSMDDAKAWLQRQQGGAYPTPDQVEEMKKILEPIQVATSPGSSPVKAHKEAKVKHYGSEKLRGGRKMPKREYFIEKLDKTAGDVKFPAYQSWVLEVQDAKDNKRIALLTDGKKSIFGKVLGAEKEKAFAEGVFDDLVKFGLAFTTKKYAFTPKFQAITEDGTLDKDPKQVGDLAPRGDRATANGVVDKMQGGTEKYDAGKYVDQSITADGALDKAEPPASYATHPSPKLSAAEKPVEPPAGKKADEVKAPEPAAAEAIPPAPAAAPAAAAPEVPVDKEAKAKVDKKKVEVGKGKRRTKKSDYLHTGKLASALAGLYQKFLCLPEEASKEAVLRVFGNNLTIEGDGKLEKFADDIQENSENVDTQGLAEEVIIFKTTEEKATPDAIADEFKTEFILPDAPPEVVDAIVTEVKDIAEDVKAEETPAGEEVAAPAGEAGKDEGTGKGEEPPAADITTEELGIEDLKAASKKEAEEQFKLYQQRFTRALKLAAKRQLLNIEPLGLFKIKSALCEHLIQPGVRYAGVRSEIAVDLIERAFQKILGSEVLDELLTSADKLTNLSDEAFLQIEADNRDLKPVDVVAVAPRAERRETAVLGKTGSGLLGGGETVTDEQIRAALPSFGLRRVK